MAQLSSYDSGNPETPETDDSVDVSAPAGRRRRGGERGCLSHWRVVFQSGGTTVPAAPQQNRTKTPGEEDFENIKLISNGAYG